MDLYAEQSRSLQARAGTFEEWVRKYDTVGKRELGEWKRRAQVLAEGPRISLILPVYQTPEPWLRRCIEQSRSPR